MRWRLYLSFFLLSLVLTFVMQNTATVNFNFFFWTFGLPGALLLLVVFIAGLATGLLLVASKGSRRRKNLGKDKLGAQGTKP